MSGIQTKYGKAFEYACLDSIFLSLSASQEIVVESTPQLDTARNYYLAVPSEHRESLDSAANASTRVVVRLEPQLENPDKNIPLYLSLQADSEGQAGDVRDVICIRKQNDWQIGLSCKHNHRAVKHSRLSATINFGHEWFGIPCSDSYFNAITPIFDELRTMRDSSNAKALWSDIEGKNERYYVPILSAFIDELRRLDKANPKVIPEKLIRYLIGRNDFYKIITDSRKKTTRVEAINIEGTLNRSSEGIKSRVNVPKLRLPREFYKVDFKPDSETTIIVGCDEGWGISMRIHNASSRIEPSLKFDVNLISVPNSMYAQDEPW